MTDGALQFRHACRAFQPDKPLSKKDKHSILEAGRLSPSSFGLEPWRLVAVDSQEDLSQLHERCHHQEVLLSASMAVSILTLGDGLGAADSPVMADKFRAHSPSDEIADRKRQAYAGYLKGESLSPKHYTAMQAHIVASFMSLAAADKGIDSLIMGGIDFDGVASLYGFEPKDYRGALVVVFGYRAGEQPTRVREPFDQVVIDRTGA